MTVKLTVPVDVQPKALLPVTVYTVVTLGVTVTFVPVEAPGIHVYVVPPDAVNVAELPTQIEVGLLTAVIVGDGLTLIVMVLVEVQLEAFAPVTV